MNPAPPCSGKLAVRGFTACRVARRASPIAFDRLRSGRWRAGDGRGLGGQGARAAEFDADDARIVVGGARAGIDGDADDAAGQDVAEGHALGAALGWMARTNEKRRPEGRRGESGSEEEDPGE